MTQDTQGFIWIATDKGISKFNGSTFKNFTTQQGLPTNNIWDLQITPDQKIWFMSKAKELGYIYKDCVYSFPNENKDEVMFPKNILEKGNEIQFGYRNKFYLLTKKNEWKTIVKKYQKNNSYFLSTVIHPKIKEIYLTSNAILLYSKNGKLLKTVQKSFKKETLSDIGQANDSLLYFMNNSSYFLLNLNNYKLTKRTFIEELNIKNIRLKRLKLINNELQLSGANFIAVLDSNYHVKRSIKFPPKLNSHLSMIDKSGNAWLSTFKNGIYKLSTAKQNAKYLLLNQKIGQINSVRNKIIINVYNKGFYSYNLKNNTLNQIFSSKNLPFCAVNIDSLDTEYYLTTAQIFSIKKGQKKLNNSSIDGVRLNNKARQLIYFNQFLWGNNSEFLNKINPKNLKLIKSYNQIAIRSLLVFRHKLLISTPSGLKIFKNDSIHSYDKNNKWFQQSILKLLKVTEKKLLFTTDGFGAYITNLKQTYLLPKSDYLIVQSAFVDKRKNIYLATNKGVLAYQLINNNYQLVRKYSTKDGLLSNNINSVYVKNNTLIVGSDNGICIISLQEKTKNQLLNIYFDKVYFNNKPLSNSIHSFKYTPNNQLTAQIATIDFSPNSASINYKYKLDPIQKKWINTSYKNLNFNDLPPNKYKLSINSHGITKTMNFQILPLWYQTSVAKIIFIVLLLSLLTGIILFIRKKELEKQFKKLNIQKQLSEFELHALRSQMNPHFVFNSLNAIQYYITKNDIEQSEKYLVKFSRLIRKFFDFSRNKFINLEQEISLLKNYLEIEKMRFGNTFNFQFNIDKNLNLSEEKIPSMLLQPIVENAVNHGLFHNEGNGLIKIDFLKKEKQLIIKISDNGVGLKKAQEIKENSIKTHISKSNSILKDRINLLNQSKEWHITYSINEIENTTGTTVKLTFKYYEN